MEITLKKTLSDEMALVIPEYMTVACFMEIIFILFESISAIQEVISPQSIKTVTSNILFWFYFYLLFIFSLAHNLRDHLHKVTATIYLDLECSTNQPIAVPGQLFWSFLL